MHSVMLRCVGCGFADHFDVKQVACSEGVGGDGPIRFELCFEVDGAALETGVGAHSPIMTCPGCKRTEVGQWRVLGHSPPVVERAAAVPAGDVSPEEIAALREELGLMRKEMAARDASTLSAKRAAAKKAGGAEVRVKPPKGKRAAKPRGRRKATAGK